MRNCVSTALRGAFGSGLATAPRPAPTRCGRPAGSRRAPNRVAVRPRLALLPGSRGARARDSDVLAGDGRRLEDADDTDPPGRARPGWPVIRSCDDALPCSASPRSSPTPCLFETPLLRMPGPRAKTRTPGTRLPRRVTTAVIVPGLPTVSVFVATVSVGQTAGGGRNGAHDERAAPRPCCWPCSSPPRHRRSPSRSGSCPAGAAAPGSSP